MDDRENDDGRLVRLHGLLNDYEVPANDAPQTVWDKGATIWLDDGMMASWDDLRSKMTKLLKTLNEPPMPDATYHDILQSMRNMLLLVTPEDQSNNRRVRNLFDALDHAILSTEPKD